ncbi:uncharacterized protein SCHCODRAFT_02082251 [Schizophyllum commune H4-8]|uniref:uncharacterized protein n=1 Tax=Schizophyllum commune (strain H4-8 / FGSC 9210) TaxID=578458 RepID=UPI00215EE0FF|nr:uncharacterized protein SCHCODRAFT_02082251 [Schizophyllum commune H4-8]KAI5886833.1 hypothetical protein SCHCODRAFT_02082251 [Schizophyllum commune H4-8]
MYIRNTLSPGPIKRSDPPMLLPHALHLLSALRAFTYDLRPSTRTRRVAGRNDPNRWLSRRGLSCFTDTCTITLDTSHALPQARRYVHTVDVLYINGDTYIVSSLYL